MKHKHKNSEFRKNTESLESKDMESSAKSAESSFESGFESSAESSFKTQDSKQDSKDSNADSIENPLDSDKDSILEAKYKELEEKYIRAYADFENTKKRLDREKYQSLEYANEAIIKDLLPILDTLESALDGIKNVSDTKESIKQIQDGIKLTIDKFLTTLGKYSVEVVDCDGEFDPNLHNAIMQVKDEGKKDGQISQVLQKGYKYKERVVRPSMVSIVKNN